MATVVRRQMQKGFQVEFIRVIPTESVNLPIK